MTDAPAKRQRTNGAATKKNVVVTGGSAGIGAATVAACLEKGYRVFTTGRDAQALQRLATTHANDAALKTSVGDVTKEEDVKRQMDEAMAFFGNQLDAVVLNAGTGGGRYFLEDVSIESYDRMFNTNMRGAFLWTQAALRIMKPKKKGQIVFTSSVAGIRPLPNGCVYAATKWALQGMALSLRAELKGTGVKLGTVNPGPVATEWWGAGSRGGYTFKAENALEDKKNLTFWNSMLASEDISDAIMSLVDQAASSNIESIVLDAPDFGGVAPASSL